MEIVLEVPDKDVARVLELVRGIKRVKVKSPRKAPKRSASEFLAGLKEAIEDVKRHQRGEIQLQSLAEVLAEMDAEEQAEVLARQLSARGVQTTQA